MTSIKELAKKHYDYIVERRRYYHMYPELTLEEVETTNAIVKDLEAMGLTPVRFENGYQGCYAIIKGGKPGKTVMLRADIDALTVEEKTGLPFASKIPGKMHACGHDTHISMLLGAAKILCDIKDELCGNVKLLFQPAEELAVGAKELVRQGVCDGVDAVYGVHIWNTVDAPKVTFGYGERMASADLFTLTVKGLAAHASAPHLGHDALVCASSIIMNLQTVVSRCNDPLNGLVISIGTVKSGTAMNIISNETVLEGSVRTFNKDIRMKVEGWVRNICEGVAKAYNCDYELKYNYVTGPVINESKELVDIARNAAVTLYGEDEIVEMEKIAGSEDFSFYQEQIPGIFGFIGARSASVPGSEKSNHHECFTTDERSLEYGAAIAAQFAYDFLGK